MSYTSLIAALLQHTLDRMVSDRRIAAQVLGGTWSGHHSEFAFDPHQARDDHGRWTKVGRAEDQNKQSPELRTDNPGGDWLENEQARVKKEGRDEWGAPAWGNVTGSFTDVVLVPVEKLFKVPGMRGEQQHVRQKDLDSLLNYMQKNGHLPPGHRGREYVPFIQVAYNGEAWVNEGNHRIMAAEKLGWKYLPAEVRYFAGGETARGEFHPDKLLSDDAGLRQQKRFYAVDDEGHEGRWVTINGAHVFIRDGEDPEAALQRSLRSKGNDDTKKDDFKKQLEKLSSTGEIDEFLERSFDAPPPPSTIAMQAALEEYTGEGALPINAYLRGRSSDIPFRKAAIDDLDKAVTAHSFPTDVVVYRGIGIRGQWIRGIKEGQVLEDKGFMSTTLSPAITRSFGRAVKINVPAGQKFLSVPSLGKLGMTTLGEAEVLLPRGLKFRVDKIPDKGPIELSIVKGAS